MEVVKGASSALYGSDAIGGVINLITRDATAPFDTTGEVSGGSFGEVNAAAGVGFKRNALSGLFMAEHHQNDGFDLTPTTFDTTGAPFERVDFMARARVKTGDQLSFSARVTGYDNHTEGRSNGELGPQEDRIDESTVNLNVQRRLAAARQHLACRRAPMSRVSTRARQRRWRRRLDTARTRRARRAPVEG